MKKVKAQVFLRFYEDKKDISVSLSDYPSNKIFEWFKIETIDKFCGKGNYQLNDNQISFIETSSSGNVIYYGYVLNNDEMELNVDKSNNNNQNTTYEIFEDSIIHEKSYFNSKILKINDDNLVFVNELEVLWIDGH